MSTARLIPSALLEIPGIMPASKPDSANVSLDASRVPYGAADIIIPLTNLNIIEALDPRVIRRGDVTLDDLNAYQATRLFDLAVQSRSVSHDGRSLTVRLATDEALAQQYTPLSTDTGAFASQTSLRAVCDYVLAKVPGMSPNMHPNPSVTVNLDGYVLSPGGTGTISRVPTNGVDGGPCGLFEVTSTAASAVACTPAITVAPGEVWTISMFVRGGTATPANGRPIYVRALWTNGPMGGVAGTPVNLTADWQRISVTATVPAGVTLMRPDMVLSASSILGGVVWDQAVAEQSARPGPYRDKVIAAASFDVDLTAYWPVTNLMPNPSVRGILGNWIAGGTNGTLARMTTGIGTFPGATDVTTYTRTTWTGNSGAGQGGAYGQTATIAPFTPVTQGRTYRVSTWARSNVAKRVDLRTQVFGRDGTVLNSGAIVATVDLPANTWTLVSGSIQAPPEAERLGPFLYANASTQWASGNVLDTAAWMLYEDTAGVDIPFFDGSTPNDARYTYAAVGAAHASAAVRTPTAERLPDIFTWRPDTSAWDFLMNLAAASGLRLFCDERRAWRLVDPNTYTIAGTIPAGTSNGLTPATATAGTDTIDRDDDDWCTGIAIRWHWRDKWGIERERHETAGSSGRVRYLEIDRPFPGAGLAAAMLARAADQGRVQDVTALARLDATPAMALAVTLPGTKPQRARLSSVQWDMGDALMIVTGRNAKTVPSAPTAPGLSLSGDDLTVTWTAPDNGGSPITGYKVVIARTDFEGGETIPTSSSPFVLNDMLPGPRKVAVIATNAIGDGPASPWSYITIP